MVEVGYKQPLYFIIIIFVTEIKSSIMPRPREHFTSSIEDLWLKYVNPTVCRVVPRWGLDQRGAVADYISQINLK